MKSTKSTQSIILPQEFFKHSLDVLIFFFSQGGYRGFYARNTITLTPKIVNDIHKRGGTVLGSSRGGHDTVKIVDSIQDRGINQVNETK
jgi:6-phosphofructokinase